MRPYADRFNSCRNRHCPKCQAAASRRWLADREAELLPVPYFHVVYTLPSKLRDIAYQNKRVVYDLLMKAAAETTLAIAADPKRLGARIGITAVLHTWGSALTHHPHVHMIVPGGGLSLDGTRWISSRSNFLVHVNVLARLFRGKMLAMLVDAHDAGQLKFFNTHAGLADKRTFKRFIAPLRRIQWVVHCKAPFAGPEQVLLRWHAGCATCAALLVPALWRSHDRHRGVRARLRAEVAPDAEHDRHVMSQTFPVRCGLPVPMRWFHAGGDPSRPIARISAPMARCCAPSVRRNGYCTLPTSPAADRQVRSC